MRNLAETGSTTSSAFVSHLPTGVAPTISGKSAAKTMRKLGLVGVCPRRLKTTTIIDGADGYPVDVVQRRWDVGALNQIWVGDITYLRTWDSSGHRRAFAARQLLGDRRANARRPRRGRLAHDGHATRRVARESGVPTDSQRTRNTRRTRSQVRQRERTHPLDGLHGGVTTRWPSRWDC